MTASPKDPGFDREIARRLVREITQIAMGFRQTELLAACESIIARIVIEEAAADPVKVNDVIVEVGEDIARLVHRYLSNNGPRP